MALAQITSLNELRLHNCLMRMMRPEGVRALGRAWGSNRASISPSSTGAPKLLRDPTIISHKKWFDVEEDDIVHHEANEDRHEVRCRRERLLAFVMGMDFGLDTFRLVGDA